MHDHTQDAAVQSLQVLVAGKLYAPEEIAGPVAVVLEGTTIRDIWRGMDAASVMRRVREQIRDSMVEVTDLGSWCLAPGYIDPHTHSFCGYDVTTGSQEDVEAMARELPRTGVTYGAGRRQARAPTAAMIQRKVPERPLLNCLPPYPRSYLVNSSLTTWLSIRD